MDKYIAKIYELMYSSIVTPYNLLENAKLDNYDYVNYYKGETGLIAEMKCFMDGEETIFYYCFNGNDQLIEIHEEIDGKRIVVFNRDEELNEAKKTYFIKRQDLLKDDAV